MIKLFKVLFLLSICAGYLCPQVLRWRYTPENKYVSFHYGEARSLTYSATGSLYIAGSVPGAGTGITFDKTYGAPVTAEEGQCIVQTADSGYVIVENVGSTYPQDMFLLKTDVYGNTIWTQFLGTGTGMYLQSTTDRGFAVTGKADGQMFLTKTDSLGNVLWTKYCASPSNGGNCIQQTPDGGYVMVGDNQGSSLVFVKTDSAGDVIWTKMYSAPAQAKGRSVEQTTDLGYIIGGSWNSGSSFYAWLLKTDSLGDTIWTKKYADGWTQGYVAHQTYDGGYVLGTTLTSGYYWIIKTNAGGDSLWTERVAASSGYPCDAKQDADSGYVVVGVTTNVDVGLWKIGNSGGVDWSSSFGGDSLDFSRRIWQTNDNGYAVVGASYSFGSGDKDIYFIKTDSSGTPITKDFAIVSLTSWGNELWTYQYNGRGGQSDIGYSIARSWDGSIYAAGYTTDANGFLYLTVISVDSLGNERWVYQSNESPTVLPLTWEQARVICGQDGNIYAMCWAFIVSLSSSGDTNWVYERTDTRFSAIAYGPDGNLYATGYTVNGNQLDLMIVSVSTSGAERWFYQSHAGDYDFGKAIVYGLDDNIYAAGCLGPVGALDFAVTSVDTTGAERWSCSLDGGSDDVAYAVTYGSNNNVYAAGCLGSPFAMDWAITSFTPQGDTNWIHNYNGPANVDDWANAVAYGIDGNVYTTGWSEGVANLPDITLISNDSLGLESWVYRDLPGWGWSVICSPDTSIYVAGQSIPEITECGFVVLSVGPPQGVAEKTAFTPGTLELDVHPNPFSHTAEIRYSILARPASHGEDGDARYSAENPALKIYNTAGRLVRSFYGVSGIQHQGSSVVWDGTDDSGSRLPGGVYFCAFESAAGLVTEKIVYVR